jgi:hypothetical protein
MLTRRLWFPDCVPDRRLGGYGWQLGFWREISNGRHLAPSLADDADLTLALRLRTFWLESVDVSGIDETQEFHGGTLSANKDFLISPEFSLFAFSPKTRSWGPERGLLIVPLWNSDRASEMQRW